MPSIFEKEEWLNAVAQLKDKATEFKQLQNQVINTYYLVQYNPELLNEYESLIFKSRIIENTINTMTNGIDYIFKIFNSVFGEETNDLGNLGLVPLVPVAVILSSIAGITYWINDSLKYLDKVEEVKRIESQGYSAEEAYKIVHDSQGGFLSNILDSPYLMIGSGLLFVILLSRSR